MITPLNFSQGIVTNPDRSTLRPGELTAATGCEYHVGSPEIHKLPGRTLSNSGLAETILNIKRLQFNDPDDAYIDLFVAVTDGGKLYESSPGTSMTFGSAEITGLNTAAIPVWATFANRWLMCNGVNSNYIAEPENVPGTSTQWRLAGMRPPPGQTAWATIASTAVKGYSQSNSGSWTNPTNANDEDDDYTYAQSIITSTVTHTWTFNTNVDSGAGKCSIVHAGFPSDNQLLLGIAGIKIYEQNPLATYKVEYRVGAGAFITVFESTGAYDEIIQNIDLSTLNFSTNNLQVRLTITGVRGYNTMRCSSIKIYSGSTSTHNIEFGITYFVTEKYIDSQSVVHESTPTLESSNTGAQTNIYGMTVTLPSAPANTFSTSYVIYRSIDEEGGGYPALWVVGEAPTTATTWLDDFSSSLTSTLDKSKKYEVVTVLYPDGSSATFPANSPPPDSKFILPYQGAMVYWPIKGQNIFYSLPTSTSPANGEKVPPVYYLTFVTAENDTPVCGALTNGGRSLIVYFQSYAMLVNFLPQASDPGTFDQRVKEFVSDKRGVAGRLLATSFSPDEGVTTIAAAIDSLGLWVTDGVGMLQNWSKDVDFVGAMGIYPLGGGNAVDLSKAMLVDNPEMRRLEFIYQDQTDQWKWFRIYYGDLKPDGQPKWLGPDDVNFRCATYVNVLGVWRGWTGDSTATGYVYNERIGTSDLANGYDVSSNIPFDITTGEIYPFNLSDSGLVSYIYPKFSNNSTLPDKSITAVGTFILDGGASYSITKSFHLQDDKKLYMHRYADRFKLRYHDISTTSLPALVATEIEVRPLKGEGRHES